MDDTKKCPYCAETIKAAAHVCRFCNMNLETGESINRTRPAPAPTTVQAESGVWSGVKLGCGMFIVLPLLILLTTCGGCGLLLKGCSDSLQFEQKERDDLAQKERDDLAERAAKQKAIETEQIAKQKAFEAEQTAKQKALKTEQAAKQKAFETEQTAKGLVSFRGEWITPEERTKRLAEERHLEQEEEARQQAARAQLVAEAKKRIKQSITGAFGVMELAYPKSDLLIPDTTKGEFRLLQVGRHYECVKQIDTGYIILWENKDESPRLALIPLRDRLTNPTAHPYEPPVTLMNATGIDPKSGFVPLKAGEGYTVASRSNGNCFIVFTYQVLTQTVAVAETNLIYVSQEDFKAVLTSLTSSADKLIDEGVSPDRVASTFTTYSGKFAGETVKERDDLAVKYRELAVLVRRERFAAEQMAKGLVSFRGEWITPEERTKRLAEEK